MQKRRFDRRLALAKASLFAGTALLGGTDHLHAQDRAPAGKEPSSNWVATVGTSVEYGPNFPGSRHSGWSALPSFDIRRFDEPAENSAADDNIDYGLVDVGGIEIGPVLGFRDSRIYSDEPKLAGIHAVKWDVDLGLFSQYWVAENSLRVRAELRHAVSNGSGLVADVGADWFQPVGEKWLFSAGPRVKWGSNDYMQTYFSVSPQEAANNGKISAFDPNAGVASVGFAVSAQYDFAPEWSIQVYHRYDRMTGDAAASPIVGRLGSQNQNIFGITLSKAFTVSF